MTVTEQFVEAPLRGIDRPVTVCQITDSHVSLCDGRDDGQMNAYALELDSMFSNGHAGALVKALKEIMEKARDADAVIFTGDIVSFPSRANIDCLRSLFEDYSVPCLYTFGNHDYSVPWQTRERTLENRKIPDLLAALPNDPVYDRLDVGGIRFVGLDDTLYQVSEYQLEQLREDLGAGLPVVLCAHIPFYAETLYGPAFNLWRAPILTGVPDDLMPAEAADGDLPMRPATREAMRLLKSSPNLAAILAGHIHFTHDDAFSPTVTQYSCANGAMGCMRRIRFVPAG